MSRYRALHAKVPRIMGTVAVKLFKESFSRQGSIMKNNSVQPWKQRGASPKNRQGRALLTKTGRLKRSLTFSTAGNKVTVVSDTPYSKLQNDGGVLTITPKMRRFFWGQYLRSGGKIVEGNPKGGDMFWYRMALHRGNKITIPSRPFVYDTPEMVTRLNNQFAPMIKDVFKP